MTTFGNLFIILMTHVFFLFVSIAKYTLKILVNKTPLKSHPRKSFGPFVPSFLPFHPTISFQLNLHFLHIFNILFQHAKEVKSQQIRFQKEAFITRCLNWSWIIGGCLYQGLTIRLPDLDHSTVSVGGGSEVKLREEVTFRRDWVREVPSTYVVVIGIAHDSSMCACN